MLEWVYYVKKKVCKNRVVSTTLFRRVEFFFCV